MPELLSGASPFFYPFIRLGSFDNRVSLLHTPSPDHSLRPPGPRGPLQAVPPPSPP